MNTTEKEPFDYRYVRDKYYVKAEQVETKPGCWNTLHCNVYQRNEKGESTLIGSYDRNYSVMYDAFEPFVKDGKDYALISTRYTGTSVLSLPDCKIIASEPDVGHGFCPTGFFVPFVAKDDSHDAEDVANRQEKGVEDYCCVYETTSKVIGHFGFVSGCVWGDDSSWKVQFLDLSDIEKGIIRRDARFGYVELLGDLKDSVVVNIDDPDSGEDVPSIRITLAEATEYTLYGEKKFEKAKTFDEHVSGLAKDVFRVTTNLWLKDQGAEEQIKWIEKTIKDSFLELVNSPSDRIELEKSRD